MIATTGTEIIFKGSFIKIKPDFYDFLVEGSSNILIMSPEIDNNNIISIHSLLEKYLYVDLVIYKDVQFINYSIKNVFVNIGLNEGIIKTLFFFDLREFNDDNYKNIFQNLAVWCKNFSYTYNFEEFICQIDNANGDEYYFNKDDYGPLYYTI